MNSKGDFTCVHCGSPVETLHKRYSSTVLKLTQCGVCKQVADKYVEYDNVIILIDLILFNRQAYRHILLNTDFKNHWKLAVLLLMMKTYDEWAVFHTPEHFSRGMFAAEQSFYLSFLTTIVGAAVFFLVLAATIQLALYFSTQPGLLLLWKAVILSNFGLFLLLPSHIWLDLRRDVHVTLVTLCTFLSQIQALSVVFPMSRWKLLLPLFVGYVSQHCCCQYVRWLIS